ncbi:hypothetical protein I35_2279 [Burkholderia cenocepacia H111]|nr:uncharacterized protein BCN122_I2146 [Burkholderia cenocepacia]EPZ86050.1 hypothetical protein BURCENK562V_C6463 [Burkholderia cenocepacia K56-2Valvano]CDN60802.1 hypothetical protein I35_2279 [Burkholderia cenocepacia H111]
MPENGGLGAAVFMCPFFEPGARRSPGAVRLRGQPNVAIVFGMTAFPRLSLLLAGAPLRAPALARLPR